MNFKVKSLCPVCVCLYLLLFKIVYVADRVYRKLLCRVCCCPVSSYKHAQLYWSDEMLCSRWRQQFPSIRRGRARTHFGFVMISKSDETLELRDRHLESRLSNVPTHGDETWNHMRSCGSVGGVTTMWDVWTDMSWACSLKWGATFPFHGFYLNWTKTWTQDQ